MARQPAESNAEANNQTGKEQSFLTSIRTKARTTSNEVGFSRLKEEESGGERWCPEETAGYLSRWFFGYVSSLMRKGLQKHLDFDDLWDIAKENDAREVSKLFEKNLRATRDDVQHPQGIIQKALWQTYGRQFIWAGFVKVLHDIIMFSPPIFLGLLLDHLANGGGRGGAFGWSFAMFIAAILENLSINYYFHILFRLSLQIKTSMLDMLYEKSLRITSAVRSEMGVGAIVNLQSNDAAKIWNMVQYLHIVWNGPFQILLVMALLVRVMHWLPSLAGLVVTGALVPLSTLVGKMLASRRSRMVALTDARVRLSTEVITGIKAIKLYAWEDPYITRIQELREKELKEIRSTMLVSSFNMALFSSGPVLVALAAFSVYSVCGYNLTAGVAFPALALFNLLRFPIIMIPNQIMTLVNANVGLKRIQKFMEADEMNQSQNQTAANAKPLPANVVISIRGGNFAWEMGREILLKELNLEVKRGQLVMVVGGVGSGKSSLLAALLGEMSRKTGTVRVLGSLAYTAQDPWIQNMTLRANILMGLPYEENQYLNTLEACALLPDLEMLPAGDSSEIGEKGINLSGGQKHRVALARALYSGAEVVLMDDPLSAVDAHVGRHLFDEAITGVMGARTRVLVTHQLQFLPAADVVVVMVEGRIVEVGSFDQLTARGVDFHKFVRSEESVQDAAQHLKADQASKGASKSTTAGAPKLTASTTPSVKANVEVKALDSPKVNDHEKSRALMTSLSKKESEGKIIKKEDRAKGQVERSVYRAYLAAWGSFLLIPVAAIFFAISERGMQVWQNFVLSDWSNATSDAQSAGLSDGAVVDTAKYMTLYFLGGLLSIASQLLRYMFTIAGSINASRILQLQLLKKVVRLPMSFFDSQPTGRLLNRFTKDVESVDNDVSRSLNSALTFSVSAIFSIFVVVFVTPITSLFIIPLGYIYYRVQVIYISTSRELKRLDSLAFSPIFSNFSETLQGLQTIRAFKRQDWFIDRNMFSLNHSNRAYWPIQVVNRWLSVRIELLGAAVTFATAFIASVVMPRNAGLVGLAISSALNLTSVMNWMVRQMTELEVNMNSVERMIEYNRYEEEAPAITAVRPPPDWPRGGEIVVENLVVRYRSELDPVLRGLTFTIRAAEKVGVCGRTGCGKSTLMMTLYRIVEPSEGRVVIDSIDTSKIGLTDLRSHLSLVPQDPVIFSGSVRFNLDPFSMAKSDKEIWESLRQAGIVEYFRNTEMGLDTPIKEGGSNLSTGQRQLLCMARALLRRTHILVLDEATSNVDNATDSLIQTTIRTAFAPCTVLTIAHRLHTIADSDRILVLDAGLLKEFDAPKVLMSRPDSTFRSLIEETARGGGAGADRVLELLGMENGLDAGPSTISGAPFETGPIDDLLVFD